MSIRTAPCTITDARRYIGHLHRHNLPPRSGLFAVSAVNGDTTSGVAVVGRPVSRHLDDGDTAEVTRLCTDGTTNACSLLYGACARAAKALGYGRIITYTLVAEGGASLRASGWEVDAEIPAAPGWTRPSRPRYEADLFGARTPHQQAKVRWVKRLAARG